jgi:HK97 family phage prohead protease
MNRSVDTRFAHALSRFPLALKRDALAQLLTTVRAEGESDVGPMVEEESGLLDSGILVMPVRGLIAPRYEDIGYCDCVVTLMDRFMADLDAAKNNASVRAIVLDISSPGGIVWLVPEAAKKVREVASVKPVHAVANAQAASAAFYLMAAAGKRYVTPSGEVGSVGVWTMHVDQSKMLADWGLDVTLIFEGEHKVDGNPFAPLTDEVKADMQKDIRSTYEMFRNDVASYVGVSPDVVESEWQARCVSASEAVSLGMVHGIATLDEVIGQLQAELQPTPELAPVPEAATASEEARAALTDVETRSDDGAVAAQNFLTGTALRFSSPSRDLGGFREEFAAGAFTESISTDDIRVIWQHDPKYVFGRVRAKTATVTADAAGVHYTAIPPDAQWSRDAVESIRRGDVTQNSFAFIVNEPRNTSERWERRSDGLYRVISSAKLVEMGPQTHPAYEDTSVAVRSMQAAIASNAIIETRPEGLPSVSQYRDRLKIVDATL